MISEKTGINYPDLEPGDKFLCATAYIARIYAIAIPSVRQSVARVDCIKTVERIIEILSLSDRPIILVFRHQGTLRKSDSFTPNGGAEYKGTRFSTNMRLYLGNGNR